METPCEGGDIMKGRSAIISKALWVLSALVIAATMVTVGGCNPLGACDGTSGILGTYYCYDDWTEDECDDYDALGANDASWTFHAGSTCGDL